MSRIIYIWSNLDIFPTFCGDSKAKKVQLVEYKYTMNLIICIMRRFLDQKTNKQTTTTLLVLLRIHKQYFSLNNPFTFLCAPAHTHVHTHTHAHTHARTCAYIHLCPRPQHTHTHTRARARAHTQYEKAHSLQVTAYKCMYGCTLRTHKFSFYCIYGRT